MTKDKQIEELGEEIYQHCSAGLFEDEANVIAEFVINKQGYRKASDVAREIFAEIEDVLNNIGYFDEIDFKALKKKYTEGNK